MKKEKISFQKIIEKIKNGSLSAKKEEKQNDKKKWILLLLLLFFLVFMTVGITYIFNEEFRNTIEDRFIKILRIDKPTAPKITADSKTWGKKQVVKIKKDAKSNSGIAYYEYCIMSEKNFKNCDWKMTATKNMIASTTGKYYVVFRGVSNKGKSGKNSNIEEIWVDNESPNIISLKIENQENGKAEITIKAEDKESGIKNYFYKLENEFKEGKESFTLEDLEEGKEYEITVRVEDKVGNRKEITQKFIYHARKENENNNQCTLNCDTNNDGICDYNCDTNGDGKPDTNIDVNGDKKPDVNIDTDGDGKPDRNPINQDTNNDGICDLNCDTNNDNIPDKNIDVDGDGKCDINCDAGTDKNPDKDNNSENNNDNNDNQENENNNQCTLNCDTNNDGICDYNCDTNGDGKPDTNIDVNGDKKPDVNIDTDGDGKPDRNPINQDTNNDGICDLNCDTNNDNIPDKNIDIDGDGKCDINCDAGTDKNPDQKPPEDPEIPILNLDKVPSEFTYKELYALPSYINFGKSSGVVHCLVEGNEHKNTSTIGIGKHLIVCTATSKEGIKVTTEKEIEVKVGVGEEEIWDGWVRLNLTYPENSTNWQWKIGNDNEIKNGYDEDSWQDYTGPILVKIADVDNIYIRYDLNGETVVIAPQGKVVVDIEPESYSLKTGVETNVKITYDKNSLTKQYRIGDGNWQDYTGEFTVGKNTLIEAKATKEDKVFDSNGNYLYTKTLMGNDSVFIGEIIDTTGGEGGNGSGEGSGPTEGNGQTPGGNGGSTTYEPVVLPDGTVVTKPTEDSKPSEYLEGPEIASNPTSLTEKVTVSINALDADIIYVSENNGPFKKYNGSFEVNKNELIKAYYIRNDGKTSDVSYYYVDNIKQNNKPYVKIDTNPSNYLSSYQNSVKVAISGSDYDKLEYSFDGVIYFPYEKELNITESKTIYAKGTNRYGSTIESKNIVTITPPIEKENLTILITASPESSEGLINKTSISIQYDSKAEKKYFKIGYYGQWEEYTGNFEVKENTTVYAYATSKNGSGNSEKRIDFLTTGISDPIISANPTSKTGQVKIEIVYDKQANIKRYKVGDGSLLDYNGEFYVYENTVITAYSKNALGMESESKYVVNNIVGNPEYSTIDKGKYILLKLNYPSTSLENNREYKYKPDGVWKTYDKQGILLIKAEFKDELMGNVKNGIKVEDENGNKVVFKDHYYVLDIAIKDIMENIFMRWEQYKPALPEIILNPDFATNEVDVIINYENMLTKKYYKIVNNNGQDTGWLEYTGNIKVQENNTTIYAKGKTVQGTETDTSSRIITNIDKEAPVIEIQGDFVTPKQKVIIYPIVTDNFKVDRVKWEKGQQEASYFRENGKVVYNNFVVEDNDIYTIYAVDSVGNESIKIVNVTNIDKEAPNIIIDVLTQTFGTEVEISIDYGDSVGKSYKLGESGNYQSYTGIIKISSYDVLNLKNEDGSFTIYAKGTDEAGNEKEVSEKIFVLDLDMPQAPDIHSTAGYPVLTEYGVKLGQENYVVFDQTRDDVVNYISLDQGTTWNIYSGPFEIKNGEIWAKSVKKISGLEIISKKNIDMPIDALGLQAYDGDSNTGESGFNDTILNVEENMWNKKAKIDSYAPNDATTINLYNQSGEIIHTEAINDRWRGENEFTIAEGTHKIQFVHGIQGTTIYEIKPSTTPVIHEEKFYPMLTEYGVTPAYNEITIDYFQTSVERLYRINEGDWKNYEDKSIHLELNDKIEVKGIDKNGKETPISFYTASLPENALEKEAYDENSNTSISGYAPKFLNIDTKMWNKKVKIDSYAINSNSTIKFYNEKNEEIHTETINDRGRTENEFIIVERTTRIEIIAGSQGTTIYEIKPSTSPVILSEKKYPTLTEYGVEDYEEVLINYSITSVQKLYSLDNGTTWENYSNMVKVKYNKTVLAKGIDKDGNETTTTSYIASLPADALGPEAYDGDINTYPTQYRDISPIVYVDESMWNKKVKIDMNSANGNTTIIFYNNQDEEIERFVSDTWISNKTYTIVEGVQKIKIIPGGQGTIVYEINPDNVPIIKENKIYPTLTENGVEHGYNEITINYFTTSIEKLYRINDGEWQNYQDKSIRLEVNDKIEAKGIDKNGKETIIASYTAILSNDALENETYDNNTSTGNYITSDIGYNGKPNTRKIKVSKEMQGLKFYLTAYFATGTGSIEFKDANGEEISKIVPAYRYEYKNEPVVIPENTEEIWFVEGQNWRIEIYEIAPCFEPVITEKEKYEPTLTKYGVIGYSEVTLKYLQSNSRKLYSLDDGITWSDYDGGIIKVNYGKKLLAKGIDKNGNDTIVSEYVSKAPDDTLSSEAYDENPDTGCDPANSSKDQTYRLKVSEEMQGKNFYLTAFFASAGSGKYISFVDKDGIEISRKNASGDYRPNKESIPIPMGTDEILFVNNERYWLVIYEIEPVDKAPSIEETPANVSENSTNPQTIENPNIKISSTSWQDSKEISISYSNGYRKEYSLDLGKTWIEYKKSFAIQEAMTILARSIDNNGKVVASSSFKITKIDEVDPVLELDIPEKINIGEEYLLPTTFTVGKSGGNPVCRIENQEVKSTKDLVSGEYKIECSLTNGAGKRTDISKKIVVNNPEEISKPEKEEDTIVPSESIDNPLFTGILGRWVKTKWIN